MMQIWIIIEAKILVPYNCKNITVKMLNNYFTHNLYTTKHSNFMERMIPNFSNIYKWWDLNKNDIQKVYYNVESKKINGFSTQCNIWAIVSKSKDGNYYIYLSW